MRDPNSGPGLVIVQGQQHPFTLEGVWRSDTLPRTGVVVDVDIDSSGQVVAMTAVPEAQLAREQAEAALQIAKERGGRLASGLVDRFGVAKLAAAGLLVLGWWFLSTVTVDAAMLGKLKISFWQLLGILNTGNPLEALAGGRRGSSTGLYGLSAVLCLVAPFVSHWWKDRRAHLSGLLPLAFMVFVVLMVFSGMRELDQMGQQQSAMLGGAQFQGMAAEFQREARNAMLEALSIGLGFWLSLAAAAYLAARAVKDYLLNRAGESAAQHAGQP
jgi:hypothetical protein